MTDEGWDDAQWRKSTKSGDGAGSCVEVAFTDDAVAIRDSKNPNGPVLVVSKDAWREFLSAVKDSDGELSRARDGQIAS